MKTFAKIVTILLALFLVFTAVVGFLDMPVADEGAELNAAQKVIVFLKTNLAELLSAGGLTLSGTIVWLVNAIDKTGRLATRVSADTEKKLDDLWKNTELTLTKLQSDNKLQNEIIMELLSTVFLASDMPASVRERVLAYKEKFDNLSQSESVTTEEPMKQESAVDEPTKEDAAPTTETTPDAELREPVARF